MDSRGSYCDHVFCELFCACLGEDVQKLIFVPVLSACCPLQLIFTRWLCCVFSLRQHCQDSITAFLELLEDSWSRWCAGDLLSSESS